MFYPEYVGKRVEMKGERGIIKYSGTLIHTVSNSKINPNDHWLGIQWDSPQRGNHQGVVEGVEYFQCDPNTSGSLVKMRQIDLGINMISAYVMRYFKDEQINSLLQKNQEELVALLEHMNENQVKKKKEITIEYDEQAQIKTSRKFKKIELVGFDRIWEVMENSKMINTLALDNYKIQDLGKQGLVGELFQNVRYLSLMENLFNSWDVLNDLQREFPLLENLIIGKNILSFDCYKLKQFFIEQFLNEKISPPKPLEFLPFNNLQVISLTYMKLNFKTLNKIKKTFQNVEELVLGENFCNDFENIDVNQYTFPNLKFLDLSENKITSLDQMVTWQDIKLKKLNIQQNELTHLPYLDILTELTHLNFQNNLIQETDILWFLSKMLNLKSLRYLNNPISQFYDKDQLRCFIISCAKKVEVLNGSRLKNRERLDSEIYYLKNSFHEYFSIKGVDQFNYEYDDYFMWATKKFPRIEFLIKDQGNPYAVEERYYQEVESVRLTNYLKHNTENVTQNFIMLKFIKKDQEFICLSKKFPRKTTIKFIEKFISKVLKLKGEFEMCCLETGIGFEDKSKQIGDYIEGVAAKILVSNQL